MRQSPLSPSCRLFIADADNRAGPQLQALRQPQEFLLSSVSPVPCPPPQLPFSLSFASGFQFAFLARPKKTSGIFSLFEVHSDPCINSPKLCIFGSISCGEVEVINRVEMEHDVERQAFISPQLILSPQMKSTSVATE